MSTPERNARCPCGSGKKYKQCCMRKQTPVQTSLPLRMRQVVALSKSKTAAASQALINPDLALEDPFKTEEDSAPPPPSPAAPSYDSLMERVFGAACLDTKAHLKQADKPPSETLEPEDESENNPSH